MKKLLSILVICTLGALNAQAVHAQTVTLSPASPAVGTVLDCYRGNSLLRGGVTSCDAAFTAEVLRLRRTITNFRIDPQRSTVTGTYTPAAPPPPPVCPGMPAPEMRSQACPTGTTGTYSQTRSYTSAASPTCWLAGAWLPATAPSGACTPVVVTPPTPPASTPTTPPTTTGLTPIDTSIPLPTGYVGVNVPLQQATSLQGNAGGTGYDNFRTVCTFSHMAYDDPIVYPGQPGASHLHTFFGNSLTNANTTAASIMTGPSTCRGGTLNRTGYWVPAMVDPQGRPRAPEDILLYYKAGYQGNDPEQINVFPPGLRMVAGNSKSTGPQDNVGYACDAWIPGGSNLFSRSDYKSNLPTCTVGQQLIMLVEMPSCWDGKNLDSPDHKSHMAFGDPQRGCPSTHPVALPVITQHVKYRITSGNTAGWRLSSDMTGSPAGSSGHADWFNGWDLATNTFWINNCTRKRLDCGTYLLGGGQMITGGEAN